MNKRVSPWLAWPIIIAVILLVAAYFTNPSEVLVKEKAARFVKETLEDKTGGFKYALVERMAEAAAEKGLDVEDYFFFKKATFTFDGNTRTVGYGYFNNFHAAE